MKRVRLLLALFMLMLVISACGADTPEAGVEAPPDLADDAAAGAVNGFVPLELAQDAGDPENEGTFSMRALSFQYPAHYFYAIELEDAVVLQSRDGVNLIISATAERFDFTIEDAVEMTTSGPGIEGVYEVLERSDLLIHGILWSHKTIAYMFDGNDFFQTMVLAVTEDGVAYLVSFAAPRRQMEALREERMHIISSFYMDRYAD